MFISKEDYDLLLNGQLVLETKGEAPVYAQVGETISNYDCIFKKECHNYTSSCEGPKEDLSKCVSFLSPAYLESKKTSDWVYRYTTHFNTCVFEAIEKALGFKLFRWQKSYIEMGQYRCYGRTTAEILKELLESGPPIDYRRHSRDKREEWYRRELLSIKQKLDAAGVVTREVLLNTK